jgi:Tfp pilus assembly protein PilZ
MIGPATMTDDRREFVRINRILDLDYTVGAAEFQGRVTDLGEGGAFIDTTFPQPAGTEVLFRLALPDDPTPVEGRARVAWHQPMLGMGLAFVGLTEEQVAQLRFYIASVYFGGDEGEEASN